MEPKPPDTQQAQSSYVEAIPAGALVKTGRTERAMKFYAFSDSDLDNVGNLSFDLNALIAFGSAFVALAITSIVECMLTPVGVRLRVYQFLLCISAVLVLGCVLGAWRIATKRGSIIARIKSESRDVA